MARGADSAGYCQTDACHVPLPQIQNGERKAYALKSKELTGPTKGVIFLEIDVIFNAVSLSFASLIFFLLIFFFSPPPPFSYPTPPVLLTSQAVCPSLVPYTQPLIPLSPSSQLFRSSSFNYRTLPFSSPLFAHLPSPFVSHCSHLTTL